MKKIIIGFLMVVLAVYLSGCVDPDSRNMDGTYVCEDCDGVLDLYDQDQWEVSGKECAYGNYTVRHGEVRLKIQGLGIFIPLNMSGHDLVDPDGDCWVRC